MKDIQNHCRKYLPHIEIKKTQFVTYRLYDSLPKSAVEQLKEESRKYKNIQNPTKEDIKHKRDLLKLVDKFEDAGYGQCFLKDDRIAQIVYENLMTHNGKKYKLLEWCIMPNHVHAMIEIFENNTLTDILHSWRSYTALKANIILQRKGQFWMSEYFDRYIRNEQHAVTVANYIANNPVKAGLVNSPDQWRWSSFYGTQAAPGTQAALPAE